MQTVAPFGTASDKPMQDWRNSDAYRQWRPTGGGFQVITQAADGQTFGDTGEARAYDAWRASQPQAATPSQPGAMPAYRPGQAQPTPSGPVGSPYGDMSWFVKPQSANPASGGQRPATPSNQEFTRGWNEAMAPYANIPGVRITPARSFGGEGLGNLAYAQSRPEPFQQSMRGFGSQMAPNDFVAQRDAFIQRLNEERGKLSAQAGVYGNSDKPNFYRPSRDFGALWRQAGDMVKDGWKNPLAGLFG